MRVDLPSTIGAGFAVVEDGPIGGDFERPNGSVLNGFSGDHLRTLGYSGGWMRGWEPHEPASENDGVGILALDLRDPSAARDLVTGFAGVLVGALGEVALPADVDGQAFVSTGGEFVQAWILLTVARTAYIIESDHPTDEQHALDLAIHAARALSVSPSDWAVI